MDRIIIIGSPGSGKSTLSRDMTRKLNIPLYHLDALFWNPNWDLKSSEERQAILFELVKKETWIIDGNYRDSLDIRIDAADTIVFLNRSRFLCVFRTLKRVAQNYNKNRIDMGEGCRERFDLEFIKYVWNFAKVQKPTLIEKLNNIDTSKKVIELKSNKEVEQFLATIHAK